MICIVKVDLSDKHHMINDASGLADQLNVSRYLRLDSVAFDGKITTEREGNLILATASNDV